MPSIISAKAWAKDFRETVLDDDVLSRAPLSASVSPIIQILVSSVADDEGVELPDDFPEKALIVLMDAFGEGKE